MKKLLKFMACALAVSFGLTACDDGKQAHRPWDSGYKPQSSVPGMNTSHRLVGEMYGRNGVATNNEDAQGIVFGVDESKGIVYLVSFTDAMLVGATNALDETYNYYNNPEGEGSTPYGYFAPERRWGLVIPSQYDTIYETKEENGVMVDDTVIKNLAVIHNTNGEINTAQILETFKLAIERDTTITLPKVYAAQACREYYRRQWGRNLRDDADPIGAKWADTKGEWYLPSIEELGALMKNRDKINNKYGSTPSNFVNENFFMPIGGENGHAYWSSSEFNVQSAWYCLSRKGDGTGNPVNDRYGYFQKNDRQNMYVRPVRTAPLR